METTRYRLKDILKIKNGRDHSQLEDGQYPVIGSGGVMRYANQYLYNGESVLLPRKGTLDNIQYINGSFWTVDTCYYTEIDTKIVNPYYLYRHLRSLDLSGFDSGASIPSMTSKCYYGIKIDLPNLNTQKRIAEILSAYDDLIENNNRRIALLEKAAQELYNEWFVRFRFPGYEATKFENGLPEGWKRVRFRDVAEIGRGSSPRPISDQRYFENGNIPWIKIADATSSKIYIHSTKEYVNDYGASFSRKLPVGSLILAASGTLGFPMFLAVEGCIHDGWLYFSDFEKKLSKYIYYVLMDLKEVFNNVSYGCLW